MALDLNKLESKLDDALDKETTESLNNWIEDKQTPSEFICEMEDCPHCAYERQQEYEAELEKEVCVDFGNWLLFQNPTYVDNTDEGNIYMVESNMNRRMTMEQIYQLYLKS
jgi:hypothetical protein